MYMTDRRSMEFIDGVHEFIKVAENHKYGGFVRCPCKNYKNEKDYSSSRTIHSHLFNSGFVPNYTIWTKNGETGTMLDNNEEEEDMIPDFAANYGVFFEDAAMGEPEEETEGHIVEDNLGQMLCEAEEVCEKEKELRDPKPMLEDYRTLLYPDCKQGQKKLGTTLELLQWKASNGLSDKGFEELLKLIKNLLPEGNILPATTYEAKKVVCPLGLEAQKIHACPNDCIYIVTGLLRPGISTGIIMNFRFIHNQGGRLYIQSVTSQVLWPLLWSPKGFMLFILKLNLIFFVSFANIGNVLSTFLHWDPSAGCLNILSLCHGINLAFVLFMNKHFRRDIREKYHITLAGTLFLIRIPSTSPGSSRGILYRHVLHTGHESKF